MDLREMLGQVRNGRIEYVTRRAQGSTFATLERRVVVTGPPELARLARRGELRVLEELVEMLKEPDRAWAAEVMLAAMTRREEKMVDAFAASPNTWQDSLGKTAYDRWIGWLRNERGNLTWDSREKAFVEKSSVSKNRIR